MSILVSLLGMSGPSWGVILEGWGRNTAMLTRPDYRAMFK
jgi:hypothetical protein